ncbi:hypothetical protein BJV74DRAFT_856930 [Russula compacta]|nr:hypothetical protein BJV74DRAFT_856930 [Russula compacta]
MSRCQFPVVRLAFTPAQGHPSLPRDRANPRQRRALRNLKSRNTATTTQRDSAPSPSTKGETSLMRGSRCTQGDQINCVAKQNTVLGVYKMVT